MDDEDDIPPFSEPADDDTANSDEAVGYRKPPRRNRFKPGKSGNPRGRPRRVPTAADMFRQVAAMPVTISDGGKRKKIATAKAMYLQIRRAALEGDRHARREWIDLMREHGSEQMIVGMTDLLEEDERLLEEFKAQLLDQAKSSEADHDSNSR